MGRCAIAGSTSDFPALINGLILDSNVGPLTVVSFSSFKINSHEERSSKYQGESLRFLFGLSSLALRKVLHVPLHACAAAVGLRVLVAGPHRTQQLGTD